MEKAIVLDDRNMDAHVFHGDILIQAGKLVTRANLVDPVWLTCFLLLLLCWVIFFVKRLLDVEEGVSWESSPPYAVDGAVGIARGGASKAAGRRSSRADDPLHGPLFCPHFREDSLCFWNLINALWDKSGRGVTASTGLSIDDLTTFLNPGL